MKFSVLLPTRNGLEYLKYAVETVRRQNYADWEIIISDNFSEQPIEAYVRSLDDARIRYYRTESFVPVTENWNNALERCDGDYVVMLGDDDGLRPDYFTTVRALVEQFGQPDFIYTSALLYCYPGADPNNPEGYLQPYGYATFLNNGQTAPYLLDRQEAHRVVRQFMDFRVAYGFNMQFMVIRRGFIESLAGKGKFFKSPFPDYYAANVMFLKASRIVVCPAPLVVIGVTPKSYGFFVNTRREAEGMRDLLNSLPDAAAAKRLERVVLPGWSINSSWLFSAEAVRADYGSEFALPVNYRRFRMLQMMYVYEQFYLNGAISREDFLDFKKRLRPLERLVFDAVTATALTLDRLGARSGVRRFHSFLRARQKQFPVWHAEPLRNRFKNILEVYEQADPFAVETDAPAQVNSSDLRRASGAPV